MFGKKSIEFGQISARRLVITVEKVWSHWIIHQETIKQFLRGKCSVVNCFMFLCHTLWKCQICILYYQKLNCLQIYMRHITHYTELCDFILANCLNTDITVSSILTRKDNQGIKIAEVNDQLRLLCLEGVWEFF